MKIIIHSKKYGDKEVLIDNEDWDKVKGYTWCVYKNHNTFYACTHIYINNKRTILHMHRLIMSTPTGMYTDHINGNGLDNRKENLRICTNQQNNMNRKIPKDNTSGCKGVTWHKRIKKWQAQIQTNNKAIYLGLFNTPEEAHKAYCEASKKYHGEFGRA